MLDEGALLWLVGFGIGGVRSRFCLCACQHRQTMPVKLDEGTLLAVLNAAAHERDALLARMAWNLLVSIMQTLSAWQLQSLILGAVSVCSMSRCTRHPFPDLAVWLCHDLSPFARCQTEQRPSALQERSLVQPTQRPLTAMPAADSGAADSAAAQQPANADVGTTSSPPDLTSTAYPGSEADLQQQQQQQQGEGQQGAMVSSSSSGGGSSGVATNSQIPSDSEPDRKLHVPCIAAFHSMIHALAAGGDLRSVLPLASVVVSSVAEPNKLHCCIA